MNLKKIGKVLTSKSVGTGPSSYDKKIIYRAAAAQSLRNTVLYTVQRRPTICATTTVGDLLVVSIYVSSSCVVT